MSIDQELIAAGARWRDALDADPSLDELLIVRRRVWPAIAAACLVVLVAAGAAFALRSHPTRDATAASGPCDTKFTAAPTRWVSGRYGLNAHVRLTYTGAPTCRISAFGPSVAVVDTEGRLVEWGEDTLLNGRYPDSFDLYPGDTVTTTIGMRSYCDRTVPSELRIDVGYSGDRTFGSSTAVRVPVTGYTSMACRHDPIPVLEIAPSRVEVAAAPGHARTFVDFYPKPGLVEPDREPAGTAQLLRDGKVVARVRAPGWLEASPGHYLLRRTQSGRACRDRTITLRGTRYFGAACR